MRRIKLLTLLFILTISCNADDNGYSASFEVLPVQEFEVPEKFVYNQTYEIKLKYIKPSSCHFVDGIYFEKNGQTRIIGVQSTIISKGDCIEYEVLTLVERSFNFKVESLENYVFKFYKGKDSYGEEIFEIVNIPVTYLE